MADSCERAELARKQPRGRGDTEGGEPQQHRRGKARTAPPGPGQLDVLQAMQVTQVTLLSGHQKARAVLGKRSGWSDTLQAAERGLHY